MQCDGTFDLHHATAALQPYILYILLSIYYVKNFHLHAHELLVR